MQIIQFWLALRVPAPVLLFGMAIPVRSGVPDMNVEVRGSLNGARGVAVDRVKIFSLATWRSFRRTGRRRGPTASSARVSRPLS